MSNIITLSAPLVAIKKQETLDAQSLRKTVAFRDINIVDDKSIEYKGTRMGVSPDFFKQLLNENSFALQSLNCHSL